MNKRLFKVTGHRPFDNDCQSVNIINASNESEAKAIMISGYGFRCENDKDKNPVVIIDSVSEIKF